MMSQWTLKKRTWQMISRRNARQTLRRRRLLHFCPRKYQIRHQARLECARSQARRGQKVQCRYTFGVVHGSRCDEARQRERWQAEGEGHGWAKVYEKRSVNGDSRHRFHFFSNSVSRKPGEGLFCKHKYDCRYTASRVLAAINKPYSRHGVRPRSKSSGVWGVTAATSRVTGQCARGRAQRDQH